jgi:hypothetical protein
MNTIQIGPHLFTPEALQAAIQQTSGLASDKKGALIGTVDSTGANVALVVKLSDHIEFQTALKWDIGTHDLSAGAKVIASW